MSEIAWVSKLEDIPHAECWVIVKALNVHIEGDQRSRENPGHGYPERTEQYVQVYQAFANEVAFKGELAKQIKDRACVRGFKVVPYTASLKVEVEIREQLGKEKS